MKLPEKNGLDISSLSSIFSDTTNSYKFYWFLAILDVLKEKPEAFISLDNLALRMVASVWYPLDYFKLSFGKQDDFKNIAQYLSGRISIDNNPNSLSLLGQINANFSEDERKKLIQRIRTVIRYVPYRFARPFFSNELCSVNDSQVNAKIKEFCNLNFTLQPQKAIYRFVDDGIEINDCWIEYLQGHQNILRGYIFWHLVKFLHKNNPNVTGLTEKLTKPAFRNLSSANGFWKGYLKENPELRCIYSGISITKTNMSLDHFLPWSFVAHDQIWNIVPTLKNVNSAKSDRLPDYPLYFNSFAHVQYQAFQFHYHKEEFSILEDYSFLFGQNLSEIKNAHFESFRNVLDKQIAPQLQTARNMGFPYPFVFNSD